MTATQVNGVAVIHSEPAESPLTRPDKPVFFKQILKLLLEDGTETYGCLHCDFTANSPTRVRPHLIAHNGPAAKPDRRVNGARIADMSLTDLLAKVGELEKVTADRDEWKKRAQKAEKSLDVLRKALKP